MSKCDQCGWPHTTIQQRQQERKRLFLDICLAFVGDKSLDNHTITTWAEDAANIFLQASEDFAKEGE